MPFVHRGQLLFARFSITIWVGCIFGLEGFILFASFGNAGTLRIRLSLPVSFHFLCRQIGAARCASLVPLRNLSPFKFAVCCLVLWPWRIRRLQFRLFPHLAVRRWLLLLPALHFRLFPQLALRHPPPLWQQGKFQDKLAKARILDGKRQWQRAIAAVAAAAAVGNRG